LRLSDDVALRSPEVLSGNTAAPAAAPAAHDDPKELAMFTSTHPETGLTATELSRAIVAGELSAREAIEMHIARIEAVEPTINAVAQRRFDEARHEADTADSARRRGDVLGPLHGVPITIKDQFHVRGLPTTFGVSRLADHVAAADGFVVAALRAAGAIVVGKTNVSQSLWPIETDNPLFGRTNNPWDPARSAGGSSGGCAAIVAAGGSPLSVGGDFGGSVRIPAAWCGVFGIKPTARRLPIDLAPVRNASGAEGISAQPGPLARSAADLTLALRVMVDALTAAPSGLNPPVPFREPDEVDVAGLRIAVLPEIGGFTPSPAIRRAVDEAADALRGEGASVDVWETAPDTGAAVDLALRIYTADGSGWSRAVLGRDTPIPLLKPDLQLVAMPNWAIGLLGAALNTFGQREMARMLRHVRRTSAEGLLNLLGDRLSYESAFLSAMDAGRYDAVLSPAVPLVAPRHGDSAKVPDCFGTSAVFNLLGLPAGVAPMGTVRPGEEHDPAEPTGSARARRVVEQGSAGLPVSVQIAARHWREDVVLALLSALERTPRTSDSGQRHPRSGRLAC
jgi:fatty acid amide hydrolase